MILNLNLFEGTTCFAAVDTICHFDMYYENSKDENTVNLFPCANNSLTACTPDPNSNSGWLENSNQLPKITKLFKCAIMWSLSRLQTEKNCVHMENLKDFHHPEIWGWSEIPTSVQVGLNFKPVWNFHVKAIFDSVWQSDKEPIYCCQTYSGMCYRDSEMATLNSLYQSPLKMLANWYMQIQYESK